jgi:hypothetical protein
MLPLPTIFVIILLQDTISINRGMVRGQPESNTTAWRGL